MYNKLNIKTKLKQKTKKKLKSSSSLTRNLKNTNSDLKHMPRFSSIFLPFFINHTQNHKLKSTNTKTTATDLPVKPNIKAIKHKSNKHKLNNTKLKSKNHKPETQTQTQTQQH